MRGAAGDARLALVNVDTSIASENYLRDEQHGSLKEFTAGILYMIYRERSIDARGRAGLAVYASEATSAAAVVRDLFARVPVHAGVRLAARSVDASAVSTRQKQLELKKSWRERKYERISRRWAV